MAEHSILPEYASGRPDNQDKEVLLSFADDIKNKNSNNEPKFPGNRPYKKLSSMPLIPKPGSNCRKCGYCVTVCPVGAIDPQTFKSDKSKCITCMRCIKVCPANSRKVNKLLTKAAGLALKKSASVRKENELFI